MLIKTLFRRFVRRFIPSPLSTPDHLCDFVATRAAFIAQTSLYGYMKTRMGTRFRLLFEDDTFSKALKKAAEDIYLACLIDLSLFSAATVQNTGTLSDHEAAELARQCFTQGLSQVYGGPFDKAGEAQARFTQRLTLSAWHDFADPALVFAPSIASLIEKAPVIDEFKALDEEIVCNSIRLRWITVREDLAKRLDAPAIGLAMASLDIKPQE